MDNYIWHITLYLFIMSLYNVLGIPKQSIAVLYKKLYLVDIDNNEVQMSEFRHDVSSAYGPTSQSDRI